jgi:hypothetical protein
MDVSIRGNRARDAVALRVEIHAAQLEEVTTRGLPLGMHPAVAERALNGVFVVSKLVLDEHPIAAQRTIAVLIEGGNQYIVIVLGRRNLLCHAVCSSSRRLVMPMLLCLAALAAPEKIGYSANMTLEVAYENCNV